MNYTRFFVFIVFLISNCCFFVYSQDETLEEDNYSMVRPKHTFSLELGMPVSLRNNLFSELMRGVINVSPYYHYNFQNNISLGLGVNYNFFWVNHVLAPDPKNTGGIHTGGVFGKLGYEKYYTERFGTDIGVKFGYSNHYYVSDLNKAIFSKPPMNSSTFLESTIAFILTADEVTSYRWVVGYAIQNQIFNPAMLGYKNEPRFTNSSAKSLTHFLTVGFGFSYYFNQR
jgi:hypothetical protein